jgi:hypothetical protein
MADDDVRVQLQEVRQALMVMNETMRIICARLEKVEANSQGLNEAIRELTDAISDGNAALIEIAKGSVNR